MSNKKRLDKIIVIDIEQTCWASKEEQGEQPPEIIEIGLCKLHVDSLEITDKTSWLIKPMKSKISEYCTNLTGITQKNVNGGVIFSHACNKIAKNFGTKNRMYGAWGEDRSSISTECERWYIQSPFSDRYLNISSLFNIMLGLKSAGVSVENALKELGMEFEGRKHSAVDDAYNTARILRSIIKTCRGVLNE